MTTAWLNRLGDRNPQLLRELRGRWQGRGIITTLVIVLLLQLLILLFFAQKLPAPGRWSDYCLNQLSNPSSNVMPTLVVDCPVAWQRWWRDIFKFLLYAIPYIFYVPGLYVLLTDIGQETQRGTLNFLRLSPRSAPSLLLGKLLGVPILGYFSLLLLLPLHLWAAMSGAVSLGFLLSFYGSLLAWGGVLFVGAMVIGLKAPRSGTSVGNFQGLGIVVLATFALIPSITTWNSATIWPAFRTALDPRDKPERPMDWLMVPINQGYLVPHLFLGLNLAIWGYFVWQVVQRTFQHPTATLLSKRQSYFLMGYGLLFVFGFTLQSRTPIAEAVRAATLAQVGMWLCIGLIATLSTPRQMILDWLQYRQAAALATPGQRPWRPAALQDWIWGEKSPGIAAIGLNLLILASFTLPPLVFARVIGAPERQAIVRVLLSLVLVMNYALLAQLMLLLKTAKRNAWAVGILALAILLPLLVFFIFSIGNYDSASVPGRLGLLLSPFLWIAFETDGTPSPDYTELSLVALAIATAGFVLLGGLLNAKLRQLQR
jgi:hypothetical protein